jgi:hypothetical protein
MSFLHWFPFIEDMAISPLNSVPKKDSLERRVIVDLNLYDPSTYNPLNVCYLDQ